MKYVGIALATTALAVGLGIGGATFVAPRYEAVGPAQVVQEDPSNPLAQRLNALPAYDTLEEAAVHASQRAYTCSHVYECGGPIAQRPDGKYVVGPVGSTYSGDSLQISHRVPIALGWKLVADYHSHPCNPDSHAIPFFSPEDIAGDTVLRITGIMVDLCTGQVHEFTPGRDVPNNEKAPDTDAYLTRGRIIGQIIVDGKSQEPNTGL